MPTEKPSTPSILTGAYSDEGKRPNQEDRHHEWTFKTRDGLTATLALVADGIGGQSTGELASNIAKETIPQFIEEAQPTASEMTQTLVEAIEEANARIYEESLQDPNRAGMGTTCTVVAIIGKRLYLAHVGDSRAYLLRDGKLRQLTIDHTWAEEALQHGRSLEEIRNHPNRGVLKRFLGIEPQVEVDTRYRVSSARDDLADCREKPLFLENTDTILLNSDGVSDVLPDPQIEMILNRYPAPKAAEELVKAALKAGASDNVTAVVLDMPEAVKGGGAEVSKWAWIAAAAGLLLLLLIGGGILFAQRPSPTAESSATIAVIAPSVTTMPSAGKEGTNATVVPTALAMPGVQVGAVSETVTPVAYETMPAPAEPVTNTGASADAPTPTLILPTPTPTRRPTPIQSAQPTKVSTGRGPLPPNFAITLVAPQDRASGDEFTLKWQISEPLSPEEFAFEPVVWKSPNLPVLKHKGLSPVGHQPITQFSVVVAMSTLDNRDPLYMKSGNTYYWSVCVVWKDVENPSGRIKCAPGRAFIYQKAEIGSSHPQPTDTPTPQPPQPTDTPIPQPTTTPPEE